MNTKLDNRDSSARDDASAQPSLIEFPAELSVKAMGLNDAGFEALVRSLVEPLLEPEGLADVQTRQSSQGKYLSVRLYFTARDHDQLQAVYSALQANSHVLFTL